MTFDKKVDRLSKELFELPQSLRDALRERLQRHSYSARLDAHHSVRGPLELDSGGSCSKTHLLVLSGQDKTNSSGLAIISIHNLLCGAIYDFEYGDPKDLSRRLVLIREPQFVATPLSSVPVFATTMIRSTPAAGGSFGVANRDSNSASQHFLEAIEVDVMMWNPDGTAAAASSFSWVCTVEAGEFVSIG